MTAVLMITDLTNRFGAFTAIDNLFLKIYGGQSSDSSNFGRCLAVHARCVAGSILVWRGDGPFSLRYSKYACACDTVGAKCLSAPMPAGDHCYASLMLRTSYTHAAHPYQ